METKETKRKQRVVAEKSPMACSKALNLLSKLEHSGTSLYRPEIDLLPIIVRVRVKGHARFILMETPAFDMENGRGNDDFPRLFPGLEPSFLGHQR